MMMMELSCRCSDFQPSSGVFSTAKLFLYKSISMRKIVYFLKLSLSLKKRRPVSERVKSVEQLGFKGFMDDRHIPLALNCWRLFY